MHSSRCWRTQQIAPSGDGLQREFGLRVLGRDDDGVAAALAHTVSGRRQRVGERSSDLSRQTGADRVAKLLSDCGHGLMLREDEGVFEAHATGGLTHRDGAVLDGVQVAPFSGL